MIIPYQLYSGEEITSVALLSKPAFVLTQQTPLFTIYPFSLFLYRMPKTTAKSMEPFLNFFRYLPLSCNVMDGTNVIQRRSPFRDTHTDKEGFESFWIMEFKVAS